MKQNVFQITRGEYADQQWLDIFEDRDEAHDAAAAYNKANPTRQMQDDLDYLKWRGPIVFDGAEVRSVSELPQHFWLPSKEEDPEAAYVVEQVFYPRGSWRAEQTAVRQ